MTTFERIRKVLVEQLGIEPYQVTPEFSLRDQMDADSLDMVEILIVVEEEFDIEISDEEAPMLDTVQDLVDLIVLKKADQYRAEQRDRM